MAFTAPATSVLSGPTSEWRRDVSSAPLHSQSKHLVEHLVSQTKTGFPALNCYQYGLAIYEVPADHPRVDVTWTGRSVEAAMWAGLYGVDKTVAYAFPRPFSLDTMPPSVGAFRGVPIPPNAKPAVGSDGALTVVCPATGEAWEFWQAKFIDGVGWTASWGGYVPDYLSHNGMYRDGFGVSASGMVGMSGQVTIKEARALQIDHALALAIPRVIGKVWSYPANRCDQAGTSTDPDAIHEGQRFRMSAAVDPDSLLMPPDWAGRRAPVPALTKAIVRATQRKGFIVNDKASVVVFSAEEGTASKVATNSAVNPWTEILRGTNSVQVLAGFPWDQCEALPFDWGKNTPVV